MQENFRSQGALIPWAHPPLDPPRSPQRGALPPAHNSAVMATRMKGRMKLQWGLGIDSLALFCVHTRSVSICGTQREGGHEEH